MAILKALGSSKLALVLVILLIVFSLAGVLLPQESLFASDTIARWQEDHPLVTSLLGPLGLFRVFHSIPFLVTIVLLAINTLACTVVHIVKEGGLCALKGPTAVRNLAFIVLHLSLVGLMAGGFLSAAARLDGYIVLTEGQGFRETHGSYTRLQEGPLRREQHKGFALRLEKVEITYEQKWFPVEVTSRLGILPNGSEREQAVVRVNRPLDYRGFSFTQDQTGFSPRLVIRHRQRGRVLVDSFVALKTFPTDRGRQYRDFLPLPLFKQRVIVTLYPAYIMVDGQVEKSGEEPDNPLLLVEMENENGWVQPVGHILQGDTISVEDYTVTFAGLRRWSSFRVVQDPGYPVAWVALWLGVAAIVLRYVPELARWFRSSRELGSDSPTGGQHDTD